MLLSRALPLSSVLVLCILVGCGTEEPGLEQHSTPDGISQAISSDRPPPNGSNGTRPTCFWANNTQAALRAMGASALDQGGGLIKNVPLTQVSQECREVLRSAVECALTQDQSVQDPVTGELYTGWWGLAPSWRNAVLDTDGRRYVTGCMVQRLNFSGTHVPILLEGLHPAIAQNVGLSSDFTEAESTVYGDLFSSPTPLLGLLPAFNVYVCWEELLPQSCGLLGLPLLFEKRVCDDAPLCGLMTMGPCALSCVQNGPYWKCKPNLLGPWFTQTVRVKLESTSCN